MNTYNVGDRVVWVDRSDLDAHNEYEDDQATRGVVKAITKEGKFSCKWDKRWVEPNTITLAAEQLMPEAEADKILSKLEAEYEVWAGPIREKMKQVGKLLEEAGELANKQNRDLTEMHEIISPLLGAMDDLGWSTSSLGC